MFPGEQVNPVPEQLHIYGRGNNVGGGALPGAGATVTVPIFMPGARGVGDVMNQNDGALAGAGAGSGAGIRIQTGTHACKRFAGLWFCDVFLFLNNAQATLELRERTYDRLTQNLTTADTTRSVWVRQVRPSVPFRATWRLVNCETKIILVTGGVAPTVFDFNVNLRSV
jgi:hypothetical protein